MKHKTFFGLFSAMLMVLFMVEYSSAAPTTTPVRPKVAVAAPTPAAPPAADYNGEWKGTTSSDSSFALIVDNNQLTYFNLNYSGAAGTCPNMSLSYAKPLENVTIKEKDFSAQATFQSGDQITLAGSFKSNTEVAGSFTIQGTTVACGAFQVNGTFTAKIGGSVVTTAPIPPTDDSASKTLRAFFDAIDAKNVDAAVALVDDMVTFNIASTTGVGKAQLKTYLQGQISRGVTYTLDNLDDQGDSVAFSLKTGNGAVTDDNIASFDDDGKIDFMVWQ